MRDGIVKIVQHNNAGMHKAAIMAAHFRLIREVSSKRGPWMEICHSNPRLRGDLASLSVGCGVWDMGLPMGIPVIM